MARREGATYVAFLVAFGFSERLSVPPRRMPNDRAGMERSVESAGVDNPSIHQFISAKAEQEAGRSCLPGLRL